MTEFVNFNALETTTDEQLLVQTDNLITHFMQKQDGFIDAELVKNQEDNTWCFIYHFESMAKAQALGANIRASREFKESLAVIDPASIQVTFLQPMKVWK